MGKQHVAVQTQKRIKFFSSLCGPRLDLAGVRVENWFGCVQAQCFFRCLFGFFDTARFVKNPGIGVPSIDIAAHRQFGFHQFKGQWQIAIVIGQQQRKIAIRFLVGDLAQFLNRA